MQQQKPEDESFTADVESGKGDTYVWKDQQKENTEETKEIQKEKQKQD